MSKWGETNGIEFWTMPLERAEEALDVLRQGFFEDETFCIGAGINTDKAGQQELEKLALDSAQDNKSIIAVEKATNKIVGVSFNKLQVAAQPGEKGYFEAYIEICKTKTAKNLIKEMIKFDSLVDVYDKYGVDSSLEIMFLGTHKDYRRRGIAVGCLSSSLELIRRVNSTTGRKHPPIVTAIFTSPWSIKAGRKLHFDEVVHVPIEKMVFENKPSSHHPKLGKDHPGICLMVKRI